MAHDLIFCVVADWQISDDNLTRLAECLVAEKPEFVVIPGDLIMANGGAPAPWDAFFDRIRPLTEVGIALRRVPGNHDLDGDLEAARHQWTEKLELPAAKVFYSFDAGPAHFIRLCIPPASRRVLREECDLSDGPMTQLEWLAQDLKRSWDTLWRFVFHHDPVRLSAG